MFYALLNDGFNYEHAYKEQMEDEILHRITDHHPVIFWVTDDERMYYEVKISVELVPHKKYPPLKPEEVWDDPRDHPLYREVIPQRHNRTTIRKTDIKEDDHYLCE